MSNEASYYYEAKEAVTDFADKAHGKAKEVKEKTKETVDKAKDKAEDVKENKKD
ncbi:hypothetical protein GSH19_01305 [Lactobacillus sp. S2-2]|uniref:hypothetical protein n=1 Tax=Lactobacillus sp. S2-2 TaxID=2692917 RepID=UPI001F247062|nr:hypothetical protein [Lactobacillus sp. S2-2]MCF6514818.1 hypothetical protein [Lactobacillus sp. S2-2]